MAKATPPANTPRFMTIAEVANSLNVSVRTLRRWIKSGILSVYRIGSTVRISEADLAAFLAVRRDA